MKYKPLVFVIALFPLVQIIWLVASGHLGPDPGKKLALITGSWAIRFLLLTLLISSLSRISVHLRILLQWRRMIGLFTFFYASIHLLVFIALILGFDTSLLLSEINKRPYITVGMLAWLLMLPLAITSNQFMIRRLGGKRWKLLHRLVYITLLLALAHVIWQVRSSWFDAILYTVCAAVLFIERLWSVRGLRKSLP